MSDDPEALEAYRRGHESAIRDSGAPGSCVIHPDGGLRLQRPTVEGGHRPETILEVAVAHRNELEACYSKALARSAGFGGRLAVKLLVSFDGNVHVTRIESSTLGNEAMEQCAAQAMRRWRFPPTKGGGIVVTTIAVELTPRCPEQ